MSSTNLQDGEKETMIEIFKGKTKKYFSRLFSEGIKILTRLGNGTWCTTAANDRNGCIGYVPTVHAFGKNGGGFETRLISYSNLEVGAATRIIDASAALIRSLTPGAMPRPPQKAAFVEPWDYGNVSPETGIPAISQNEKPRRFFSNTGFWSQPLPPDPEIDPKSDYYISFLEKDPSGKNTVW